MVKKVTIMKLPSQSSVLTLKISDVVPVPERGFQTSLAVSVTCGGDNRVVEGTTWSPSSSAGPPASRVCEVGPEQCRQHEICRPANEKSRSGVCDCVVGADPGGGCLPPTASTLPVPTPASLPIKLFVSVESQVVQLPTSSANLSALART